jgi:hypothetical protein
VAMKREPGTLEVEHILPPGAESARWRAAPISEPERRTRWVWAILGVTALFVVAGSGYYWHGKLRPAPAASPVVPQLNPAAKVAGATAPAIHPATQLAVGLAPLTSQQPPPVEPATAPVAAQSPPAVPVEPPKFATGLRPITNQVPPPAAEAPAEPMPAPRPQPRPARRAAPPSAAPSAPSPSSGRINF